MPSFTEILNKPAAAVEKPKPYPVGTYLCVVQGQYKERQVNNNPVIDFDLKPVQAQGDVDSDDLASAGGLGRTIRHTIFLTNQDGAPAEYPLVRFLEEHLGIEKSNKTLREMLAEAPGKQVLATLKHAAGKDGQEVFANVAGTARV